MQSISGDDIAEQNAVDLPDTLYRNLGAVNINGTQSNPWQNDVTYRGFVASPLTGSPIGLSVYVDGMRFNDGFGDTVSWDLIPKAAIAGIDVIPGSNPLFGLNTLGGALAVRTKSGREFPGTRLSVSGGSFARRAVEAEHGRSSGPIDWYVALSALDEEGWRDRSRSALRQPFASLGWDAEGSTLRQAVVQVEGDAAALVLLREGDLLHHPGQRLLAHRLVLPGAERRVRGEEDQHHLRGVDAEGRE